MNIFQPTNVFSRPRIFFNPQMSFHDHEYFSTHKYLSQTQRRIFFNPRILFTNTKTNIFHPRNTTHEYLSLQVMRKHARIWEIIHCWRLPCRTVSIRAFSSPIRLLFFEITSPAAENTRSEGTLVAGIEMYFTASLNICGNLFFPSVAHHRQGSDFLGSHVSSK